MKLKILQENIGEKHGICLANDFMSIHDFTPKITENKSKNRWMGLHQTKASTQGENKQSGSSMESKDHYNPYVWYRVNF